MKRIKSKVQHMDLISKKQLLYMISQLDTQENTIRDKALIAFLYLTGARISEVLRTVKVYDVAFEDLENIPCIVIHNIPCLKRRKGHEAKRNIGFPVVKDEELIQHINSYMKGMENDDHLFNMTRVNAYLIVRKFDDRFFPHYFRHLRLSHLTTMYGFNSGHLRQLTGWTNDSPAAQYVHLNWRDNAKKMM